MWKIQNIGKGKLGEQNEWQIDCNEKIGREHQKLRENFILDTGGKTVLDKITTTCKVCGTQSTRQCKNIFIRGGCQNVSI